MGVVVTSGKSAVDGMKMPSGLRIVSRVSAVLCYFLLIDFGVCAIVECLLIIRGELVSPTSFYYIQQSVLFGLYALAARQAMAVTNWRILSNLHLTSTVGRRLRIAALALFLVVLFELMFSTMYAVFATGELPFMNIGIIPSSAPTMSMWWEAFGGEGWDGTGSTVRLDFPLMFAAALVWALSYVLEYALKLREDQETVV